MEELFTIILLHYNQEDYIYVALDSIVNQTYKNIELIISDDSSISFNKTKINEYLKDRRSNIKLKFILNKENMGTVKTLNQCLDISTGEYILIFGADDRLNNKYVLEDFYKSFKKYPERNIIAAQCMMCEKNINKKNYKYTNTEKAMLLNDLNHIAQFRELAKQCIYAAGAVAYRKLVFKKFGFPDEKYKLIEDLTYWLFLTSKKEKIYFEDFLSLDHRDGGVSKKQSNTEIVKHYYKDLALMYQDQIIPYLSIFNKIDRESIIRTYFDIVNHLNYNVKDYKKLNAQKLRSVYIKNPTLIFIKLKDRFRKILSKIKRIIYIFLEKKKDNKFFNNLKFIKTKIMERKRQLIFHFFWLSLNLLTVCIYYEKNIFIPIILIPINMVLAKILTFLLYSFVRRIRYGP